MADPKRGGAWRGGPRGRGGAPPSATGRGGTTTSSRGRGGRGRGGGAFGGDRIAEEADEDELEGEGEAAAFESHGESAESRRHRFESSKVDNRFLELKPLRELERELAIKQGLLPDPDKQVRLEEAIAFVGTCEELCPEFERHEREYQNNVDLLERYPGTNRIDPARAVKAFHRPAGQATPLPSDVRPPHVLRATLDYLFHEVLPQHPLHVTHPFFRDRTRSVRQDFTMQNVRDGDAIECNERIARYHVLALGTVREQVSFSESQELEQLRKVLKSLNEFYDDARTADPPISTPNEPEFRAYNILTHLRDPDIIWSTELLPPHVFNAPIFQTALTLHALAQRSNLQRGERASLNGFSRFFKFLSSPAVPYLFGCILSTHFGEIRKNALHAMRKSFVPQHSSFPVRTLAKVLGCDDEDEVVELCEALGLETAELQGKRVVKLHKAVTFNMEGVIKAKVSQRLVEAKRGSTSYASIIDGDVYATGCARCLSIRPCPDDERTHPAFSLLDITPEQLYPDFWSWTSPSTHRPFLLSKGALVESVRKFVASEIGVGPIEIEMDEEADDGMGGLDLASLSIGGFDASALTKGTSADDQLAERLRVARQTRQDLWTPGTFLSSVSGLVDLAFRAAPKPTRHGWTALVSTASTKDAFSSYLACKFDLAGPNLVASMDTTFADLEVQMVLETVGLVIFDCTQGKSSSCNTPDQFWQQSKLRLHTLASQVHQDSVYAAALLVLVCPDRALAVEAEEALPVLSPLLTLWTSSLERTLARATSASDDTPLKILKTYIDSLAAIVADAVAIARVGRVLPTLPANVSHVRPAIRAYILDPAFSMSPFSSVEASLAERPFLSDIILTRSLLEHLADFVRTDLAPHAVRQETLDVHARPLARKLEASLENAEQTIFAGQGNGKKRALVSGGPNGAIGQKKRKASGAGGAGGVQKKPWGVQEVDPPMRKLDKLGLLMRDAQALLDRN
ncbi:hypothetical protein RQP46_001008 [Phenoliferia psychrophenolica]